MLLPALIMIFGALFVGVMSLPVRRLLSVMLPLFTLYVVWQIPMEVGAQIRITVAEFIPLTPLYVHEFSHIFATVFCISAAAAGVFGWEQKHFDVSTQTRSPLEAVSALVYSGGAVGVSFAGDLITAFLYIELMATASTMIVWSGRTEAARASAVRYAMMHFLAGVIMLVGVCMFFAQPLVEGGVGLHEAIAMRDMALFINALVSGDVTYAGIAAAFILLGVLINLGAPMFSAWIADSYPEASPSGSVFLSAYTTKTSVFLILTMFAGAKLLMLLGVIMVMYGIIYAMLENDMRRILSYSIVNQVGFMVTGVGIGTPLALAGVATHAFCHIIYKALLFMSAGAVYYRTQERRCSRLGGLYKTMPLTTAFGVVGAMAISAFPFTSGFVSKSMVTTASAQEHLFIIWMILVAASAGVFLHAGIKFPWFVFFQKDSGLRPKEAPRSQLIAMGVMAALCVLPGVMPSWLYMMLPDAYAPAKLEYEAYTASHIVAQFELLLFSGAAFFVFLPLLRRTETISLDTDYVYRRALKSFAEAAQRGGAWAQSVLYWAGSAGASYVTRAVHFLHNPRGLLARGWGIGQTMLIATFLLGAVLVLNYITGSDAIQVEDDVRPEQYFNWDAE